MPINQSNHKDLCLTIAESRTFLYSIDMYSTLLCVQLSSFSLPQFPDMQNGDNDYTSRLLEELYQLIQQSMWNSSCHIISRQYLLKQVERIVTTDGTHTGMYGH